MDERKVGARVKRKVMKDAVRLRLTGLAGVCEGSSRENRHKKELKELKSRRKDRRRSVKIEKHYTQRIGVERQQDEQVKLHRKNGMFPPIERLHFIIYDLYMCLEIFSSHLSEGGGALREESSALPHTSFYVPRRLVPWGSPDARGTPASQRLNSIGERHRPASFTSNRP